MKKRFLTALATLGLLTCGLTCHASVLNLMTSLPKNDPTISRIVSQYRKSHKDTSVKVISSFELGEATALSQKPDIYLGSDRFVSNNADCGIVTDIGKLVSSSTLKDILPGLLPAYKQGGKLFGIPIFGVTTMVEYNIRSFTNAGVPQPKMGWQWDRDFYAACKKLSQDRNGDGKNETFGVVGIPNCDFLSVLFSYGGTIANPEGRPMYVEPNGLAGISFVLKLHQEGLAESVDQASIDSTNALTYPLVNGKSAMSLTTMGSCDMNAETRRLQDKGADVALECIMVPTGPAGCVPVSSSLSLALPVTCKHKEAATQFVRFMLSPQGQSLLFDIAGGLPTTVSGFSNPRLRSKLSGCTLDSYAKSRARMVLGNWPKAENSLWQDVSGIIDGSKSLSDLVSNARALLNQLGGAACH